MAVGVGVCAGTVTPGVEGKEAHRGETGFPEEAEAFIPREAVQEEILDAPVIPEDLVAGFVPGGGAEAILQGGAESSECGEAEMPVVDMPEEEAVRREVAGIGAQDMHPQRMRPDETQQAEHHEDAVKADAGTEGRMVEVGLHEADGAAGGVQDGARLGEEVRAEVDAE